MTFHSLVFLQVDKHVQRKCLPIYAAYQMSQYEVISILKWQMRVLPGLLSGYTCTLPPPPFAIYVWDSHMLRVSVYLELYMFIS